VKIASGGDVFQAASVAVRRRCVWAVGRTKTGHAAMTREVSLGAEQR